MTAKVTATTLPDEPYKHVRAAFINAIAEEGTKAEAIDWLQRTWNECCTLRQEFEALLQSFNAERLRAEAAEAEVARLTENYGIIYDAEYEGRKHIAKLKARAEAMAKDAERLVFACSNKFSYVEFAHHVLRVGGMGDISDCRVFIDAAKAAIEQGAQHER